MTGESITGLSTLETILLSFLTGAGGVIAYLFKELRSDGRLREEEGRKHDEEKSAMYKQAIEAINKEADNRAKDNREQIGILAKLSNQLEDLEDVLNRSRPRKGAP